MDSAEEICKDKDKDKNAEKPKFVVRSVTDVQRIKLQKLMSNPQKEVIIPKLYKKAEKDSYSETPSFVRNVMGSSAGAGSGEFHVYRHLRRKEYARQKQIQQKSVQEELDDAFRNKLEQNRKLSEEKTAKKRAKRMKKKKHNKIKKPKNPANSDSQENESDSSEAESDKDEESAEQNSQEKEESKCETKWEVQPQVDNKTKTD